VKLETIVEVDTAYLPARETQKYVMLTPLDSAVIEFVTVRLNDPEAFKGAKRIKVTFEWGES